METRKMITAYFHGECVIKKVKSTILTDANRLECSGDYIIAPSEVSGNHHMLEVKEGVKLYEKNGVVYVKNEVPTDVYCVVKERHDNITLEPGIYEVTPAQEYDYLTQEKRNVAD